MQAGPEGVKNLAFPGSAAHTAAGCEGQEKAGSCSVPFEGRGTTKCPGPAHLQQWVLDQLPPRTQQRLGLLVQQRGSVLGEGRFLSLKLTALQQLAVAVQIAAAGAREWAWLALLQDHKAAAALQLQPPPSSAAGGSCCSVRWRWHKSAQVLTPAHPSSTTRRAVASSSK